MAQDPKQGRKTSFEKWSALSELSIVVSLGVSAFLVLSTILYLATARTEFFVIGIDPVGRAARLPSLNEVNTLPPRAHEQFALEFIRRLRSISSDRDILIQDMRVTEQLTVPGSRAFAAYNQMENADPAQKRLDQYGEVTRGVTPLRVFKSTDGKWVVEWTEDTLGFGSGRARKSARYQASLLIRPQPNVTSAHLRFNPLALGVYEFDLQRISQRVFTDDAN